MAFPVIAATNTSTVSTAGTSHTVNLPASIASGDLLIVFFSKKNGTSNTLTYPAGWTQTDNDNGTNIGLNWAYRIADGTEGASISVTSTASVKSAHCSYRINSWHGTTPPEASGSNGSSATPDPPSEAPSWGSADNLWLECGAVGSNVTWSAASTNYTNLISAVSTGGSGGSNASVGSARRNLTGASDDPDNAFTISGSAIWEAVTLAVRPASAAFDPAPVIPSLAQMENSGFVGRRLV